MACLSTVNAIPQITVVYVNYLLITWFRRACNLRQMHKALLLLYN